MYDPKIAIENIKIYCNTIADESDMKLATLIELEETIYNLRRWVDNGGSIPEELSDDR